MNKALTIFASAAVAAGVSASAQSVPVAYSLSQQDLRGTARFMSMAGAFGALGADLSTLSQNPGGIGVYRNSDIGFSVSLDANSAKSMSGGFSQTDNLTRFNLNNIGGVFTLKLPSSTMPNINFGFTYHKVADFNRRFGGRIPNLQTSLSNYIAGICNANGLIEADVATTDTFDPYNPNDGYPGAPWISILGYSGLLVNPEVDGDQTRWYGQFGDGTTGTGYYDMREKGTADEYNIAIGGNINNVVYWGLDFGITSIDYRVQSVYGESLNNAYVYNPNLNREVRSDADWDIYDNYKVNGTGVNFKLGVIVKPIQELRLGLAFHTPTYYNLNETYYNTYMRLNYPFDAGYDETWANDGVPETNSFNFRTPWRVIASIAGVVGNKLIVSADYEWASYNGMRYSAADPFTYYDPWFDWGWDDIYGPWYSKGSAPGKSVASRSEYRSDYSGPNAYANGKIKQIYQNTNTLRIGAEYRVLSNFSVRAGYSWTSSPVKNEAKEGLVDVPGTGVLTSYTLDNITNHVTCGLGYRYKGFYADLAYVYTLKSAEYHPFSPDVANPKIAPKAKVDFDNSQVALTLGFKF